LPANDADFATRWRLIKLLFSKGLPKQERLSSIRKKRKERGIYPQGHKWQRLFWEHTIRDDNDFRRHVDYVHWNPMKHGLVQTIASWPYSSFHRYVRDGIYPEDWAGGLEAQPDIIERE
jgi:putative transposase